MDYALAYFFFGLPYLVAVLLGLGMMLFGAISFANPRVGLTIAGLTYVADAMLTANVGLRLGVSVFLPDLPFVMLALVALMRFSLLKEARPRTLAFYLFALVFAMNLVHGLVVFKASAGPPARPAFYALAACAYLLSFPMDARRLRSLYNVLVWVGVALLAMVVYRMTITALDVRELLPPSGSFQPAGHSKWRVISSGETLVVAEAMVALWVFYGLAPGWTTWRFLVPLLAVAAVVLQHRSVWLASLAGYGGFYLGRMKSLFDARHVLPLLVLLIGLAGGVTMLARSGGEGGGGGVGGDVVKSARDAAQLQGTAGERLRSWQQMVEGWAAAGPRSWVAGQPFGTVYDRIVRDENQIRRISYTAHNYYVELLASQGLVGLLSFLAIYLTCVTGLWRLRRDPDFGLAARWLLVMVSFQMVYYLTYGVEFFQSLFLGAALSLVCRNRALAAPVPERAHRAAGRTSTAGLPTEGLPVIPMSSFRRSARMGWLGQRTRLPRP